MNNIRSWICREFSNHFRKVSRISFAWITTTCLLFSQENCYASDYQKGIAAFSTDVLQNRLEDSQTENQLTSPLGISFLLSMIKHGVGLEDQEEIDRILHLPQDEGELAERASEFIKKLTSNGFDIAGLLYLNPLYQLNPQYQSLVSQSYQSRVETGSSADQVNAWVKQATNGQIKRIVDQRELTNFFILLANAIHFKADWVSPFKKSDSYPELFATPKGVIETPMMHKTERMDYYQDEMCQAIRLTYRGSSASILLVLPTMDNDFSFMNDAYLDQMMQGMEPEMVKLSLPKFKLEQEVDIKDLLHKLGMVHLFNDPDFSSMIDLNHAPSLAILPQLCISKIKQNLALHCDEKGTEASAVTTAIIAKSCVQKRPSSFKEVEFNRPFFVALVTPEAPIFFGLIRNPSH